MNQAVTAAIRVAVLQQQRLLADALGHALRSAGLEVVVVTSLWADLLDSPALPVDVAILDLHLGDGVPGSTRVLDLAQRGTACIVLDRHSDTAAAAAAVRAGARAVVTTSDPLDELVTTIRAVAAGERRVPPSVAPASVDPRLGRQEERALVLYASGRSIREVAADMRTTEQTIKSYLKRGRRKYRTVGIDIGTRVLLRSHAMREGWLTTG